MKSKKLIAVMILALIAFANAVYLTTEAYSLKARLNASAGDYSTFCDISDKLSCSNVLLSPAAQFFGYPFPALAMFVYPIIFLVALLGYLGKCRKPYEVLLGIGVAGILFNGYYIYQEAFTIGSFCPLCLMCSAILLAIIVLAASGRCGLIKSREKDLTK